MRFYNVQPIPIITRLTDRFQTDLLSSTHADRFYDLVYPVGMISDTIPPEITGVVTGITTSASAVEIS
jgi:hypothetical protein